MPKVTFLPLGVTVDAVAGDTILDVALNHDIPLQHACGGFCSCTTCEIVVKAGDKNLSAMEDDENERLDAVGQRLEGHRLGCQTRVMSGDVTVEMVNSDD